MFSHINKLSPIPVEWYGWGLSWKITKIGNTPVWDSHQIHTRFLPKTGIAFPKTVFLFIMCKCCHIVLLHCIRKSAQNYASCIVICGARYVSERASEDLRSTKPHRERCDNLFPRCALIRAWDAWNQQSWLVGCKGEVAVDAYCEAL